MTQRPNKRTIPGNVGELYGRVRDQERLHHGPWIYVGSGTLLPDGFTSPAFQNSWSNSGGGLQELRFRWIHGGGLEIQGSITGGTDGTIVFTLPNDPIYLPDDGKLRLPASDDAGGFVVYTIATSGDVSRGAV